MDLLSGRSGLRGAFLVTALAALGIRLVVGAAWPIEPVADAAHYRSLALGLANGEGFDGAFRPPLYPFFVSLFYRAFGEGAGAGTAAVRVAQAFIDTGTCLIVAVWAGSRLGAAAGLVTLLLGALSMSAIASTRVLLSEALAAFFLTAAVVIFDRALAASRRRAIFPGLALVGVVCGLLTLTRGIMLLFPVALAGFLVLRARREDDGNDGSRRDSVVALGLALTLLLSYAVTLAPWLARNHHAVGGAVVTTQVGITFYSSHFLEEGQAYGVLTADDVTRRARTMSPLEGSRFLVRETLERLAERPARFVTAYPAKLANLLAPIDYEVMGRRQVNWTYALVFGLTVLGFPVVYRRERALALLALLPLLYLMAMALPFYGTPRLRLPAEPLLAPLAAAGALRFARSFLGGLLAEAEERQDEVA